MLAVVNLCLLEPQLWSQGQCLLHVQVLVVRLAGVTLAVMTAGRDLVVDWSRQGVTSCLPQAIQVDQ